MDRSAEPDRLAVSDLFAFLGSPEGIRWVAGFWFGIVFIQALDRAPIPLGGIAAFLLQLILWFVLYRVASEALLDAAADVPGINRNTLDGGDGLALKHVALWLAGTLLVVALSLQFGVIGIVLGVIAIVLVLPAATILLTLGRNLLDALWPPSWLRLAHRIGSRDYALLCGTLVGIGVFYALVSAITSSLQPGGWLVPIAQFTLWSAGVLGWFHLAGRAVALHRHELNLVEPDTEPERPSETFTRDPETLWEEIRSRGGTRAMHAEMARQLARQSDPAAVRDLRIEHGRMHIEALLHAFEAPDEAVDRAAALLEIDPGFVVTDAKSSLQLVEAAADQGMRDAAIRLAENHLSVYPRPPCAARVRLRICELLSDDESSRRRIAEEWFRELMVADLDEPEQERLKALKSAY